MLTIKWLHVRGRENVITVGAINYIVAAFAFLPEFLSASEPIVTTNALWTGSLMGASYFIAYFFVIYAIKWVGASASTVIAALSLLIPIVCGVYIWGEDPNTFQVVGVGLSLLALSLIGGKPKHSANAGAQEINQPDNPMPDNPMPDSPMPNSQDSWLKKLANQRWFMPAILVIFFILCGLSRLAQEAFKHVCEEPQRPTFIVTAFTLAAIPSSILLIKRRKSIVLSELGMGCLMGVANVLQTHFILKALDVFDGFIVFPVVGAGGLILTAVVATGLLGERISRKTTIGIAIACLALTLLNLDFTGS